MSFHRLTSLARPTTGVLGGSAVLVGCLALSGCLTGERPTFAEAPIGGEPGTPTGDPNVDAVLQRLEISAEATATASYAVTLSFGSVQTAATVVQDSSRRSVTIGDVRFLWLGSKQTCDLASGTCESGILDARVSDTGVTSDFDAAVPARRLRTAITKKIGDTTGSQEQIADNPSLCVTVPLSGGDEQYCAGDYGIITRWIAADVKVELLTVTPTVDEQFFATVR